MKRRLLVSLLAVLCAVACREPNPLEFQPEVHPERVSIAYLKSLYRSAPVPINNAMQIEAYVIANDFNGNLRNELCVADSTLVVTLGTAWVYRLKDDGRVVGNCHKVPEREFVRQRLSVEEIVETYVVLLDRLWRVNPRMRVLFTVSPVRHLKDGLHGNQLSKATLLLVIDELCRRVPERCVYFPAYEMVMDELRDYRFYAEDMAHPSKQAVDYVWERFVEHCTDEASHAFMAEWSKVCRALEHRPFQPESEKYHEFVRQNLLKITALKEKFPYLEVQNEIDLCHTLLKKSLG